MFWCRGEDWRTAPWAKRLNPSGTALGDLDVARWLAVHNEVLDRSRHDDTESRACENLAVGAVANQYALGIDLSGEANRAAVTRAIDMHFVRLKGISEL
jgi:hypothetical protein